jgi:hypothetical protein
MIKSSSEEFITILRVNSGAPVYQDVLQDNYIAPGHCLKIGTFSYTLRNLCSSANSSDLKCTYVDSPLSTTDFNLVFTSANKFKLRINKAAPIDVYLFDIEYSETVTTTSGSITTTTINVKHRIHFRVAIIDCNRPDLVIPIDNNVYLVERGT